jgi:hypothetical protein
MNGPTAHSFLGGSVAKQFINCPGSVRIRRALPPTPSSVHAEEGTRLHALQEHCLREGEYDAGGYVGALLPEDPRSAAPFTKEQIAAVNVVLRHVETLMQLPGAELFVETKFNLADIREGMFGTCDVCVWTPDRLHVVDAKYGKGVAVEAAENDQLRYYAAGARRVFGDRTPWELTLTIVQPRLAVPHPDGPVQSWDVDLISLMAWEAELAEAVERTDAPDAPLAAGDWCRFCPGARIQASGGYGCAAVAAKINAARDDAFAVLEDPPALAGMTAAEIGRRYSELALLAKYIKDFSTFVRAKARTELPDGFEWAPGGRSWKWNKPAGDVLDFVRAIDGDTAAADLTSIVTPIQAEKALGKDTFAAVAAFVDKGTSAPSLVKKGSRKQTLTLTQVADFFAANHDAAFSEIE